MKLSPRSVLMVLAVAFVIYLSVRGLWWSDEVSFPLVLVGAHALFLATTMLCIFWETRPPAGAEDTPLTAGAGGPAVLPAWAGVLAVVAAFVVPNASWLGAGPEGATEAYATWPIGGIGALMTIVMVRRRTWTAWIGMAILTVTATLWIGFVPSLALGLVGSFLWVGAAQGLLWSTDRAARDAVHLAGLQRAASAWLASQSGRQRERRVQVQRALAVAGPVLARTVATGGALDEEERVLARLAEGRLRDELRGPRLLDDDVRVALEATRRRGATVTMLDEGGLDGIDEARLRAVRRELAETLREARSERIYIRTSPHETVAVTIVGRSHEDGAEEETVDLWREITLPRHP